MTEPDERLMVTAEVAAMTQLHEATIRRYAREGLIPSVRLPGGYRFYPSKVRAALQRLETGEGGRDAGQSQ